MSADIDHRPGDYDLLIVSFQEFVHLTGKLASKPGAEEGR